MLNFKQPNLLESYYRMILVDGNIRNDSRLFMILLREKFVIRLMYSTDHGRLPQRSMLSA